MLAILKLSDGELSQRETDALMLGAKWLRDLQNRDGGWPTFCRGWGKLPFDRSSPDISAHVLRALHAVGRLVTRDTDGARLPGAGAHPLAARIEKAIGRGFRFLDSVQRDDGSWLPLWFGNQFATDDENPLYGTAKVLAAYKMCGFEQSQTAQSGYDWVLRNQNPDGGWGGMKGTPSSVEETGLAIECLHGGKNDPNALSRGLEWIVQRVSSGGVAETAPIGFYFAKLWYFEQLYPLIFAASALNLATGREE